MSLMFNFTDRPAQKSPGPSRLQPVGDTTALANYNIQRVTTRVFHLNIDSAVSPTTLNHIGLGFSRFRNPNFSESVDQGWVQPNGGMLGLTGLQFEALLRDHPRVWRPLVYCWRGGQRSASFTHVLRDIGWDARQLVGGYKTFRRAIVADLPALAQRLRYRVVCGLTGSGKTRLLQRLRENLEAATRPLDDRQMAMLATLDCGYRFIDGSLWSMDGSPYRAGWLWDA